jgi:hypothetical protein
MTSTKQFALKITKAWHKSIASIFECGDLLTEAKAKLKHGEFQKMIEHSLPFKPRTAEMLMRIAADKRLTNPKHASLLPPSWYVLYRLSTLSDEDFEAAIVDGTINPEMRRDDVPQKVTVTTVAEAPRQRTMSVEHIAASASPNRVIVPHYVEPPPRLSDMSGLEEDTRVEEDRAENLIVALEQLAELADPIVMQTVVRMLPELDHERQTRVRQAIGAIGIIADALKWSDH